MADLDDKALDAAEQRYSELDWPCDHRRSKACSECSRDRAEIAVEDIPALVKALREARRQRDSLRLERKEWIKEYERIRKEKWATFMEPIKNLDKAQAQIADVRALHTGTKFCRACNAQELPCLTLRVLDGDGATKETCAHGEACVLPGCPAGRRRRASLVGQRTSSTDVREALARTLRKNFPALLDIADAHQIADAILARFAVVPRQVKHDGE